MRLRSARSSHVSGIWAQIVEFQPVRSENSESCPLAASRAQQLTGATTDDGELRGGFVFLIVVAVVLVVLVCGGCAYYQNAKKKKAVEVGLDADSLKFEGVGP